MPKSECPKSGKRQNLDGKKFRFLTILNMWNLDLTSSGALYAIAQYSLLAGSPDFGLWMSSIIPRQPSCLKYGLVQISDLHCTFIG